MSVLKKNGRKIYAESYVFEPNYNEKVKRISSGVNMTAIRSNKEFAGIKSNTDEIDKRKFNNHSRQKAAENFRSKIFQIGNEKVNRCEIFKDQEKTLLRHQTCKRIVSPKMSNIEEVFNSSIIKNNEKIKSNQEVLIIPSGCKSCGCCCKKS